MNRIAVTNTVLVMVAMMIITFGTIISLLQKDFTWLSRFGALIVFISTLFFSKHIAIGMNYMLDIEDSVERKRSHYIKSHENRRAVSLFGPLFGFVGSMVWGFADLINIFFGW